MCRICGGAQRGAALSRGRVLGSGQWLSGPLCPVCCFWGPRPCLCPISGGHPCTGRRRAVRGREGRGPEESCHLLQHPVPGLLPHLQPAFRCLPACPRLVQGPALPSAGVLLPTPTPGSRGGRESLGQPGNRAGNPQLGRLTNRKVLEGWGQGPLMEAENQTALRAASHPPSSFRCSSAPGLATDGKHSTYSPPGRVSA